MVVKIRKNTLNLYYLRICYNGFKYLLRIMVFYNTCNLKPPNMGY